MPSRTIRLDDSRPAAHAAWAYPLAGLPVAGLTWLIGVCGLMLGLPTLVTAIFALGAGIMLTGALHEDGLADCADGFWGGWTPERRLEIMKDSRVGVYGVIALVLSLSLRAFLLAELLTSEVIFAVLLAAATLSRAGMPVLMLALKPARPTGLSGQTGRPTGAATALAVFVTAICLLVPPITVTVAALAGTVAALLMTGVTAQSKINGQTGDVLGASQQFIEVAVLLACIIVLR